MAIDDRGRPPVLAHQRFAADAAAFEGLPLAARFERIHATNLWGAATSKSGLGSEHDATATLRGALPGLLARLGAASLLDAPCGEAGWVTSVGPGVRYTGADIVPAVIDHCRGALPGEYVLADLTSDPLPRADAILCRDCLVHLSFANIGRALANFRASGARWLLTTSFGELCTNHDCTDGDWRALNFERPPFGWPAPVERILEDCTEAGGGWADKALGVWRIADLPDQPGIVA